MSAGSVAAPALRPGALHSSISQWQASNPAIWRAVGGLRAERRLDPAAHLAERLAAQHHLVAVLEERARASRRAARSAPRRSSSARSGCRAPRARGRRSCPWRAGRRCAGSRRSPSGARSAGRSTSTGGACCVRAITAPFSSTSSAMSYAHGSSAQVRAAAPAPAARRGTRRSASSSSGTTQRLTEVANDLPRKGPSGWYSQAWMSRADQSFTSTMPNTWSSARSIGTGSPIVLGMPITKPASSSMSSRRGRAELRPGRAARTDGARACRSAQPCPRARGSRPAGGASWAAAARRRAGTSGRGSWRGGARSRSRRSRPPRRACRARRAATSRPSPHALSAPARQNPGPRAMKAFSDGASKTASRPRRSSTRSSTRAHTPPPAQNAERERQSSSSPSARRSSTGSRQLAAAEAREQRAVGALVGVEPSSGSSTSASASRTCLQSRASAAGRARARPRREG